MEHPLDVIKIIADVFGAPIELVVSEVEKARLLDNWTHRHPNVFVRVAEYYGVTIEQSVAIIDDDMLNGDASFKPVGFILCPPPRPASAAAVKSTWASAARAAAVRPSDRTSDAAQVLSAATMQTGASSAFEPSSATGGDASIVDGDRK